MDPSIIHIILTCLLGIVVSSVSYLLRTALSRVSDLEKDLANHKLEDTRQFAELHAHKDEVMRRLDAMDAKLDRLLEK